MGKDPVGEWNGITGRVNADMVQKYLPKPTTDGMIFICGPPGMMNVRPTQDKLTCTKCLTNPS